MSKLRYEGAIVMSSEKKREKLCKKCGLPKSMCVCKDIEKEIGKKDLVIKTGEEIYNELLSISDDFDRRVIGRKEQWVSLSSFEKYKAEGKKKGISCCTINDEEQPRGLCLGGGEYCKNCIYFKDKEVYLSSDINARIKFYDWWHDAKPQLLEQKPWLYKLYQESGESYYYWLFSFCFGNMQEDFVEKIKKLEQKP